MKKHTVFSGIQPSGSLTIGNFIGTVKIWVKMQEYHDCFYCIADQHAMTNQENIKDLNDCIFDTLSLLLSCGINPQKSTVFLQSHVLQHTQLYWILNCHTYFGEMKRMTQFKTKLESFRKNSNKNIGLFSYPVLMASDILLYQATYVPIGSDQKQHLEFTKLLAKRFNALYGKTFTIPKPIFSHSGQKIFSLQNPEKKMSKSDKKEKNTIFLLDKIENVKRKIFSARTDSDNPPIISFDPEKKPGISNLISILSSLTNETIQDTEKLFLRKSYKELKETLFDVLSNLLKKIQKKFKVYRNNKKLLKSILKIGKKKAEKESKKTLKKVYKSMSKRS